MNPKAVLMVRKLHTFYFTTSNWIFIYFENIAGRLRLGYADDCQRIRFRWHISLDERFTCVVPFVAWAGPQQRQIQRRPLLFAPISETDDCVRFRSWIYFNFNNLRRYRTQLVLRESLFKRLSYRLVETISLQ
jgi:hypothetical protein